MAEDAGDPTTVELTADTGGYEAALDRAAGKVASWTAAVEGKFTAWSSAVQARTDSAISKIDALKERLDAGEDIGVIAGKAIGGGALGAIGEALAGPPGAALGVTVGSFLGGTIGGELSAALSGSLSFAEFLGKSSAALKLVGEQIDDTADAWDGLTFGFGEAWADIRRIVSAQSLESLFAGSIDDVLGRVGGVGSQIGERVADQAGVALVRLMDLIDGAVERFKGPLAATADFVQKVGVQIGWVEEGTAAWGDAFRNLQNVGLQAVKGILTGIGYLNDGLVKVKGYIQIYVADPLLRVAADFARKIAEVLEVGAELTPGPAGDLIKAKGFGLRLTADNFDRLATKQFNEGFKNQQQQWGQSVAPLLKWFDDNVGRFRELMQGEDERRKKQPPAEEPAAGADPAKRWVRPELVNASVQGSQEAMRMILRDTQRPNKPADPAERAAKAAEDNARVAKDAKVVLTQARDYLKELAGQEWEAV